MISLQHLPLCFRHHLNGFCPKGDACLFSHDPISKEEMEVLREFRKSVYKRGAHSNSVSSRAQSKLYSTDPGFNHWDLLDSGADMSVRTSPPEGTRSWEARITLSTAERGRNVEVTQMSNHTVPSTILKKGIPLQALVTPQVRRNITSAGEVCDVGKGFEIHMHSHGALIYPSGTLPIVDTKLVVAEAIRPPLHVPSFVTPCGSEACRHSKMHHFHEFCYIQHVEFKIRYWVLFRPRFKFC
jgi:hypothetical protein